MTKDDQLASQTQFNYLFRKDVLSSSGLVEGQYKELINTHTQTSVVTVMLLQHALVLRTDFYYVTIVLILSTTTSLINKCLVC